MHGLVRDGQGRLRCWGTYMGDDVLLHLRGQSEKGEVCLRGQPLGHSLVSASFGCHADGRRALAGQWPVTCTLGENGQGSGAVQTVESVERPDTARFGQRPGGVCESGETLRTA